MWGCYAAALLLAVTLISTRWYAVNVQTGTTVALSLDQGAAIFIHGEAPMSAGIDIDEHKADQIALQWWFAEAPHSFIAPLWAPLVAFAALAMSLRRYPAVRFTRDHGTGHLIATPVH